MQGENCSFGTEEQSIARSAGHKLRARIGGIEGSTLQRSASAVERTSMSAVSAELKHPSLASNPTCMAQTIARLSYAPLAQRAGRS